MKCELEIINDAFRVTEPGVLNYKLEGHTDAIWGLSLHAQKLQLLSCSADGTVKLWSPVKQKPLLLSTYVPDQGNLDTIHVDSLCDSVATVILVTR